MTRRPSHLLAASLTLALTALLSSGCSAALPTQETMPGQEAVAAAGPGASSYQLLAAVTPSPAPTPWTARGQVRIRRWLLSLFRPTYDVLLDGKVVGVIERSTFSTTSTWRLRDAKNGQQGRLEQAAGGTGFVATVKDPQGKVVGSVSQEVKLALAGSGAVFTVRKADNAVVLRTGQALFSTSTTVDILDPKASRIGVFVPAWFSSGQPRSMDLFTAVDGRLMLAFVAAQLDLGARKGKLAK